MTKDDIKEARIYVDDQGVLADIWLSDGGVLTLSGKWKTERRSWAMVEKIKVWQTKEEV